MHDSCFRIRCRVRFIFLIGLLWCASAAAEEAAIPRLVATSPQPGAQGVESFTPISLSFSMAMADQAIEQNFSLFPEIKGSFHWQGTTLVFTPQQPFVPSTTYIVSLGKTIRAQNDMPLAVTFFSTSALGLRVGRDNAVMAINPRTGREQQLVSGEDPSWSRDNRSVFFVRDGQLWQVQGDGSAAQQLTREDTIKVSLPRESPRHALVAFNGTNAAGIDNMYSREAASGAVRQLTSFYEPAHIGQVSWSPDGLYLAFLRGPHIWVMNQDGTNMKRLTTDELPCKVNFAWSPGGTKIAFAGQENIWVADLYSLEVRKVSFDDPQTGWMDWSADNRIAYESAGIVVMNADGSDEQRLSTGGKRPSWIGDTELLSFVLPLYSDVFSGQLWKIEPRTQKKEKIADIDLRWPGVVWSRNVRRAASP